MKIFLIIFNFYEFDPIFCKASLVCISLLYISFVLYVCIISEIKFQKSNYCFIKKQIKDFE